MTARAYQVAPWTQDLLTRVRALPSALVPRARPVLVPFDSLLMGDEAGLHANTVARVMGNPLRPSTSIVESPHVRLLLDYARRGDVVFTPDEFERTEYYANAAQIMSLTGRYFEAVREGGIVDVARRFAQEWSSQKQELLAKGHSQPSEDIRVRRIRHSSCFSVIDGHHRLAHAFVRGEERVRVAVQGPPMTTPMQAALRETLWTTRPFELYQPLPMPEVQTSPWRVIRRCDDRLAMMKKFLESSPSAARPKRFLDISSSYGYFVHEMAKLGFDSHGVEIDPIARDVGVLAWSLPDENVHRAEAVRFLESAVARGDRYEVVACLSLLHHFALGMGCINPEQFIRLADEVTGSVLFLDTGQGTERWFADSLRQWTPDFTARWLKENTSFRQVVALGTDSDGVGPYAGNYGRTLFACTR